MERRLLVITTIVEDPQYLQRSFVVSVALQEGEGRIEMESNAMHRHVVARVCSALVVVLLSVATARPAFAQFEFTGSWTALATEDVSNDSLPVDYMGLPLTEEGRAKALTYQDSVLAMVEHQCEAWPPTYLATGRFRIENLAARPSRSRAPSSRTRSAAGPIACRR